ncbi:Glutathione peroxidase, partial [Caligus rogercresseyi]
RVPWHLSALSVCLFTMAPALLASAPDTIYDFSAIDIDGNEVSLEKYRGHVTVIVNLVELYNKYSETEGLRILAFPCNQFGGQEPGTNAEIKEFAASYG